MNTTPIVVQPRDVTPASRRAAARRGDRRRGRAAQRREERGPVNITLWLPTTLIFALLAPFAVLLLPFLYLAPRHVIVDPARTLAAIGRVLLSMGGTTVEVDAPDCRVHLRLL